MYSCKIIFSVALLYSLQVVVSHEENEQSIYHKEEDCKDTPKVILSDGNERFVKVYEEAMRESKMFQDSSNEVKEIMLEDVTKMRKMLGTPEYELTDNERDLTGWVKELEALSTESLKKTLRLMIEGSLYVSYDSNLETKTPNVQAY